MLASLSQVRRGTISRVLRGLLLVAGAGASGVALLVALMWRDHRVPVSLPEPSGRLAVGRFIDVWADDARPDPVAPPGARRELLVWIWFPAERTTTAVPADYRPAYWPRAMDREQNWPARLIGHDSALVQSHSLDDVPVSSVETAYPVVILRGGSGAPVADYTTLAEDLASHGYVVVGFDAPYRTSIVAFPDGRIIRRPNELNPETVAGSERVQLANRLLSSWTADVALAVDRLSALNATDGSPFERRLDLQALGVIGHSLGGATAAAFCHDDPRCRAAINMDGRPLGAVVADGLARPLMLLMSDHAGETDTESAAIRADIASVYDHLPPDSRRLLVIRGANHFSFSDQMVLRSPTLMRLLEWAGFLRLPPRRGLVVSAEYVRRFLDVHLKGAPASLLAGPATEYPEVMFEERGFIP